MLFFYYLASAYDKVFVDAESLQDAIITADAFSAKSGAVIVGVCFDCFKTFKLDNDE